MINRTVFHVYEDCSAYEKRKFLNGYIILKKYEHFYLCAKVDENDNILYRECFSIFDIDGVPKRPIKKNAFHKGLVI